MPRPLPRRPARAKNPNAAAPKPRGRPRSEAARKAILKAAYRLLKKRAPGDITTPELAAKAGVSTATLYRWWPSKEAVLLDAFFEESAKRTPYRPHKSPLERLRTHLLAGARFLASEDGRVLARLIMAVQENDGLRQAFLQIYIWPRRAAAYDVINDAVRAGELPPDTDPEALVSALQGALYARLLLRHGPLDEAFAETLFKQVVHRA